jgi:hypothetical protein
MKSNVVIIARAKSRYVPQYGDDHQKLMRFRAMVSTYSVRMYPLSHGTTHQTVPSDKCTKNPGNLGVLCQPSIARPSCQVQWITPRTLPQPKCQRLVRPRERRISEAGSISLISSRLSPSVVEISRFTSARCITPLWSMTLL